ncbi:MAG: flagellar basal body rod protein FlgB [bacterium]|nr:flagellar basal body rod protein FlgB [bacterium]
MSLKDMIFDKTPIPTLAKGLDAFSRRQRSIAHNLANIETPGYQRRYVRFEEELKSVLDSKNAALKVTSEGHLPFTNGLFDKLEGTIFTDQETPPINGVNNVSLDQEMADLATNNLHYQTSARLIRLYFDGLRNAIRGGGAS